MSSNARTRCTGSVYESYLRRSKRGVVNQLTLTRPDGDRSRRPASRTPLPTRVVPHSGHPSPGRWTLRSRSAPGSRDRRGVRGDRSATQARPHLGLGTRSGGARVDRCGVRAVRAGRTTNPPAPLPLRPAQYRDRWLALTGLGSLPAQTEGGRRGRYAWPGPVGHRPRAHGERAPACFRRGQDQERNRGMTDQADHPALLLGAFKQGPVGRLSSRRGTIRQPRDPAEGCQREIRLRHLDPRILFDD